MNKLLLFATIIILIGGCKKVEDPKTTYQVVNNSHVTNPVELLDGSMWEVIVYSYNGTNIVRQDSFDQVVPDGGKSPVTEVTSVTDQIKVSFKYLPARSAYAGLPSNVRYYYATCNPIVKGKNNIVTLESTTLMSTQMIHTTRQLTAASCLFSFVNGVSPH